MHKIYLFVSFEIVKKYEMVSKTQLKKLKNFLETESKKDSSKQAKEVRIRFYLKNSQDDKDNKEKGLTIL